MPLNDDTLNKYSVLLHQWTHAILLSIDGHDSGYRFPILIVSSFDPQTTLTNTGPAPFASVRWDLF